MFRLLFFVVLLLPPSIAEAQQSNPRSRQRMDDCLDTYAPESREWAECWFGVRRTKKEMCGDGFNLLASAYLDNWQKQALYESMSNRGCLR